LFTLKKFLFLIGCFYACSHIALHGIETKEIVKTLEKIQINIKKLNPNDEVVLQRWKSLQLNDPVKNLTLEHVEDFINTFLRNKDMISRETYNDAKVVYNVCEKEALFITPTDSRTYQIIFYRKTIATQTFENFFSNQQLKEAKTKILRQNKNIETLSTGVYFNSGLALLFLSYLIWKCLQ
jgi:hypothetical protein